MILKGKLRFLVPFRAKREENFASFQGQSEVFSTFSREARRVRVITPVPSHNNTPLVMVHLTTRGEGILTLFVSFCLKGIETYSINLPKQKAPDVTGRFSFKKPGILMFDLFFPSTAIHGWHGSKYVLTCLDYWSSYCGIFALHDKKKETVAKAASIFLKNFITQSGTIPRRAYQDRGTDLKGIPPLFEKEFNSTSIFVSRI